MIEVDEKAFLTPDGQEIESVKETLVELNSFSLSPLCFACDNSMLTCFSSFSAVNQGIDPSSKVQAWVN